MTLSGKSIVVTGASGIAAATVRRLVEQDARVFVASLDEADCRSLHDQMKGRIGWLAADLREELEAERAFAAAADYLGSIDGVFAVAGASGRRYGDGPADSSTLAAWQTTIDLNLTPAFLSVREGIRNMTGPAGGSVVLMGSVLASHPSPAHFGTHAYATAKGAIESLATAAAAHYASRRIRINAIAAGLVETPMARRAATDPVIVRYAERKQPLAGGLLQPGAIADAALFLLSDESSQITGQTLVVDGGWSVSEARA